MQHRNKFADFSGLTTLLSSRLLRSHLAKMVLLATRIHIGKYAFIDGGNFIFDGILFG